MRTWEQWVHRPRSLWLRKALFQVHLWAGISLGLYVIVVCLSGSAAVFNSELYTAFQPKPMLVPRAGPRMSRADVRAAAQRAYPGRSITRVSVSLDPREAATVSFGTDVFADQRFFDPYAGRDVGNARPFGLRMVSFFSVLHMRLLLGYNGRLLNGAGGLLSAALCLTGLVIWWPGMRRWRRSLTIHFDANPKRLNWDLHNAVGFWTFAIVFMWAITGAYLVFPMPFENALVVITGDHLNIHWTLHALHVGNFAGWPVKVLWAVLGLAPPLLFVTGFIMWWHRALGRWLGEFPAKMREVRRA
jgi:uncharacterized iron-regulated membrane protein